MAIGGEALDVILRILNLRGFQAGMHEAALSTREVGTAAKESSAATSASMNKSLGLMGLARKAMLGIAAGAAIAGLEGYKMGVQFDKQLQMVQSEAGASAKEVSNMRKAILDMAGPLRQSPEELAKGLYHVEALGFRGTKALNLLRDAAHMANISGADLEQTTTALGGAMIVGVKGAGGLTSTMGQLVAIAGAGNMRMQNLVDALGNNILPAAKVAGLSLQDVGAALATLTDAGMPASSAAAQLATAFHFLSNPSDKAAKTLKSMGLSQRELVDEMNGPQGLLGALTTLKSHVDKYAGGDNAKRVAALGNILPGGRGRVLLALMTLLDQYGKKRDQIAKTTGDTNAHVAQSEQTNAAKLKGAWADLQSALISVSDTYKGPLTGALAGTVKHLADVARWVTHHKSEVKALGIIVGTAAGAWLAYRGAMILATAATVGYEAAMGLLAAAMLIKEVRSFADAWYLLDAAMAANPVGVVIVALAALAAGVYYAYKHWKWFHNAVTNTWHWLKGHWPLLVGIITGPFGLAVAFIATHWKKIKHGASEAVHYVANRFRDLERFVSRAYRSVRDKALSVAPKPLRQAGGFLGHALSSAAHFASGIGSNAQGTDNWRGGLTSLFERGPEIVDLPGGTRVVPLGQSMWERRVHAPNPAPATPMGGGDTWHHTTVVLPNGKVLAEVVNKANADRKARR